MTAYLHSIKRYDLAERVYLFEASMDEVDLIEKEAIDAGWIHDSTRSAF